MINISEREGKPSPSTMDPGDASLISSHTHIYTYTHYQIVGYNWPTVQISKLCDKQTMTEGSEKKFYGCGENPERNRK